MIYKRICHLQHDRSTIYSSTLLNTTYCFIYYFEDMTFSDLLYRRDHLLYGRDHLIYMVDDPWGHLLYFYLNIRTFFNLPDWFQFSGIARPFVVCCSRASNKTMYRTAWRYWMYAPVWHRINCQGISHPSISSLSSPWVKNYPLWKAVSWPSYTKENWKKEKRYVNGRGLIWIMRTFHSILSSVFSCCSRVIKQIFHLS